MLQILKAKPLSRPGIETEPVVVRPRSVQRHTFITIAKARHLPLPERARLAALWLLGWVTIKPTRDLARFIFRVHANQINDALSELQVNSAEPNDGHAWWSTSTSEDKAAFVRAHLAEIWRLVDLITA